MLNIIKNINHLFFPEICLVCEDSLTANEYVLCTNCSVDLPLTRATFKPDNLIEKSFYGRVTVNAATSLLFFSTKNSTQKLIHELKYKGKQEVGTYLGKILADELAVADRFSELDAIIKVPLHASKFKQRGYNQLTTFAKTLSNTLNIPVIENVLVKTKATKTQTFKNRFERAKQSASEKFKVRYNELINYPHVLLVDDVITTGATLEACVIELSKISNIKISIATMAYTV